MFKASKGFVSFLKAKGVDTDLQFLSDGKFYRNIGLVLVSLPFLFQTDLFCYKPSLSTD